MIFDHLILDFDGVLNGELQGPFHFQEVREGINFQIETKNFEVFQQLLTLTQPKKISICSNWRYYFSSEELTRILEVNVPLASSNTVFCAENYVLDKILLIRSLLGSEYTSLVVDDLDLAVPDLEESFILHVDGDLGLLHRHVKNF